MAGGFLSAGASSERMSIGRKIGMVSWPIVFLLTMIAAVGVAMLYSGANGSWDPWAARHMVRFLVALECFALDVLDLGQVLIQVVLQRFGALELSLDRLERVEPPGDVREQRAGRLVQLGEPAPMLGDGFMLVLDRGNAVPRIDEPCLDVGNVPGH